MSTCPSCGSSNTKKMQMVWASGSRTGQSQSTGVGVSSRGTIGVGIGRGKSQSQSHLAAACAPPKRSKIPLISCAVFFILVCLPLFQMTLQGLSGGGVLNAIFGLPLLVLSIYAVYRIYIYLDKKNNGKISDYGKTWICLKCGDTYI